MDEKPERPAAGAPDLAAALRRARIESAERAEAVAELRELELGRLALLESALKPVVRQAPPGVDLFDLSLARGERPRVFIDMVAFIEMARDRRTYRFFQDTVYGRVVIAESPKIDTIVAACTNYVARRLIERERALASGGPRRSAPVGAWPPPSGPFGGETASGGELEKAGWATDDWLARDDFEAPPHPPLGRAAVAGRERWAERPPAGEAPLSRVARRLFAALSLLLTTLGAITLVGLLALVGYLAWAHELGAVLSFARNASSF